MIQSICIEGNGVSLLLRLVFICHSGVYLPDIHSGPFALCKYFNILKNQCRIFIYKIYFFNFFSLKIFI